MSEYKTEDSEIFKQFAYQIYSDIQKYVNEHRAEYEKWLEKQKNIDMEELENDS